MQRTSGKSKVTNNAQAKDLYTLEVFIIGGPVTEEFVDRNPVIARTIAIRGDQTLAALHQAIFKAFDREDEHMYQFQVGGKGPNDPDAMCYGLPSPFEDGPEQSPAEGDVTQTPLDALNLHVGDVFGYWFDFGDDWWHQIDVVAIEETAPPGRYPKVIKRVGESPPQYADMDE